MLCRHRLPPPQRFEAIEEEEIEYVTTIYSDHLNVFS